MSLSTFYHTVRHLRARQIVGQVRIRLQRKLISPVVFRKRPAPHFPGCTMRPITTFLPPGPQQNARKDLVKGTFSFLNESGKLGWPPVWYDGNKDRLWQYNLHYFEYLWALDYASARTLIRDWSQRHALQAGRIGWESYPISLRLTNWCAYFWGAHREDLEEDASFEEKLWHQMFIQAEWLMRHMETHLMGNHVLENAIALTFCGASFSGEDAVVWKEVGLKWLTAELEEQVLGDGVHFERTPLYQVRLLYALVSLWNVGDEEVIDVIRSPVERMVKAVTCMCHPDGDIALFNDSAMGVQVKPEDLLDFYQRVSKSKKTPSLQGRGVFALSDSGYFGARNDKDFILCDAGAIGPAYQPGHGHGDIFSFELSLNGRRAIVDTGVCTYERGAERSHCRSTRAHNTVEVDGQDQCEFWASFRVARRGQPHDVAFAKQSDGFTLEGWHDGYLRLPQEAKHHRRFRWYDDGVLLIRDTITASSSVSATARLHLSPDCEVVSLDEGAYRVNMEDDGFYIYFIGQGDVSLEEAIYFPEFGVAFDNRVLAMHTQGMHTRLGCAITRQSRAVLKLDDGLRCDGRHYAW